jgi:hypothetical protein
VSKSQRDKGRRGELEVLALFTERGFDGSLRYEQPEYGGDQGDVETTVGNWEVKRRASLPSWMQTADEVRGVFVRKDRGPWLVLVRADDLLALLSSGSGTHAIKTTIRITKGKIEGGTP